MSVLFIILYCDMLYIEYVNEFCRVVDSVIASLSSISHCLFENVFQHMVCVCMYDNTGIIVFSMRKKNVPFVFLSMDCSLERASKLIAMA